MVFGMDVDVPSFVGWEVVWMGEERWWPLSTPRADPLKELTSPPKAGAFGEALGPKVHQRLAKSADRL